MNGKVGVFDSGLGGLSILKELIKILPQEDIIFYEDSINNPYGEKTEEELFDITTKIVDYLIERNCKIIVIACNTATTSCMKYLREKYKEMIFIGTVPAIKVAYDCHYKNTIILSTPFTKNSKRVQELIETYHNNDQKIINLSGENLANLIELDKKDEIKVLLERVLGKYRGKVDSVVLGCTHYPLIKKELEETLPGVAMLDGANGVARETKRQLEINNLLKDNKEKGSLEIINSKSNELIKRSYEILNS